MRELNHHEVEDVSGAGLIADAGAALGSGIGKIIDAAKGGGTKAAESGESLGNGIGLVVEAGLNILGKILGGLFGRR